MRLKGVSYDVGRYMAGNWRPDLNARTMERELAIIRDDLCCNAVRICGLDIGRLTTAAQCALDLGLTVWLSPEMWDRSGQRTLAYIRQAAAAAESVRKDHPSRLVFLVGSELTLFMQGIVPGRSVAARMGNPGLAETVRTGAHLPALNGWLRRANSAVRDVFQGDVTYASLVWEGVDWSLFDYVGVDHYRSPRINDRYVEMLKPSFAHGKPLVITEFGTRGYKGAETTTEGMAGDIIDYRPSLGVALTLAANAVRKSLLGAQLPPPRFRLKAGNYVRDEATQAREVATTLKILDGAGVDGAFVMTFVSPTAPYNENPRLDLDMNSYSLVRTLEHGHGVAYPDMTWEPKEAFKAVAAFYAER